MTDSITCPSCGRSVEPGFRFCDNCGHKLEQPAPDEPTWHVPIEETSKPMLDRLRQRRDQRNDDDELFKPPQAPDEPPTGPVAVPPRETLATKPAPTRIVEATKPAPTWHPVARDELEPVSTLRLVLMWILHVVIAFVCGAALLFAAGAVASMLSNGRTALLELRGLPIFLAGATAVIVFTLLRTGRVRLTASRQLTAMTVIAGFVLLVGGSAFAYRPANMHGAQQRLDRILRVYGPAEKQAFEGFEGDITDWNSERDHYRSDILAPYLGGKMDSPTFQVDASASEETLKGAIDSMNTHANGANNLRVRDALQGLASIYDDQMSGINLLTRGVLLGDQGQTLVAQGDTRFKDGGKRAISYFHEQVEPLLNRMGIDPSGFLTAVSG
jgi:hypothetical protein